MSSTGFTREQLQDPDFKAEGVTFPPEIAKRPSDKNRKCTDAFMCIIFSVFVCSMFGATIYGYSAGDPWKLSAPIAYNKEICGYGDNVGYDYLYIYDVVAATEPKADLFSYGVCVKECPDEDSTSVDISPGTPWTGAGQIYPTYYLITYCSFDKADLPAAAQENWTEFVESFSNTYHGSALAEVYEARWTIAFSPLLAVAFTFIYIYFMDKCAYWLSWFSVIVIELALIGTGLGCLFYRQSLVEGHSQEWIDESSTAYALSWSTWLAFIFAGFYCLVVACCFSSLKVAIAVIETAADYFADTKRVVFVPVLFFFVTVITFIGWLIAMVCVSSIGTITVDSVISQTKDIVWPDSTYYLVYFMVFGIIWLIAFILAVNEFVIIVSAVTWYYSDKTVEDDDGIPGDSDVSYGFKWAFRYHMGSLAMGSLLLACIWVVRAIFEYLSKKMQKATGENGCTKCLVSCMRCCLACFDRFIRYLNRNAYIYMAVSNESFCSSALNAFLLILKNSAKFGFVDGIADVFMFLAKFLITILGVAVSYPVLGWISPDVESPYLPLFTIGVLTYMISSIFISIFDTGSNTILVCYLLDKDIAASTGAAEPDHIPPTMTKFFNQQHVQELMNKTPKDEAKENLIQ